MGAVGVIGPGRITILCMLALLAACRSEGAKEEVPENLSAMVSASGGVDMSAYRAPAPEGAPRLGVIAQKTFVHERPAVASKKLGYLTLGAKVARAAAPAGTDGCPGGWYAVHPRGFVCVGDAVTLDLANPILRAAEVRPDVTKPLPYKYGFVRAVAPLYLRVPNEKEQFASEFALAKHLEWWKEEGLASSQAKLGANDALLSGPGAGKRSTELGLGELFGGKSDADPPPFWLSGSTRLIPNVSTFKVPKDALFANRVRRHAGLAFVGSFAAGPESLNRRFAVTTDLRLVPVSKVKPETASSFHGVELGGDSTIPFAFIRAENAHAYTISDGGKPKLTDVALAYRSAVRLSGKSLLRGNTLYRETADGRWLSGETASFVLPPVDLPPAANAGEKWVEVSIENQTLVMWEGKKPVFATLVSTGQDGLGDPHTTKSTIRGTFRIRHKHVTATMDSEGKSAEGGDSAAEREVRARDGEGRRKGEGTFELRDVPYVQYFEKNYAIHAAYWHDAFGTPRSHGCINMSPIDAQRVFSWTDPPVPEDWHGAIVGPDVGTTIVIHK